MKFLKCIWWLALLASFFGATLAFPSHQNIFAYRVLLLIHWSGFVLYWFFKRREMELRIHIKEYMAFYLVWLLWAAASFVWADSRIDVVRHAWFLFSGISIIGFSVFHFRNERDLKYLAYAFVAVLTVFLGVSLWEHYFRYNVGVGGSAIFFERGIPNGFMGNPNDLATYLALYVPFFFCLIKYGPHMPARVGGILGMALTFHIILLTRSRANLLALAISVAVMIWFLRPWKIVKKIKLPVILGVGVLCIGAGVYLYCNQPYFLAREIKLLSNQFDSLQGGSSVSIRIVLLEKGFELLKGHCFLGVGAGNVEYHMMPFKDMTAGIINLHNWWAEILVNYGVIIWGLYLVFFGKMLKDLYQVYHRDSGTLKMMAETLLVSFSGFVLAVVSSSTIAGSRYVWVLFASAFAVINIGRRKMAEGNGQNFLNK